MQVAEPDNKQKEYLMIYFDLHYLDNKSHDSSSQVLLGFT